MLSVHDVIHIPRSHFLSGVSIVTSLNDTSAPHVREHLRSCFYLTNPCTKWKVLSLTKPKCKIYETKSLSHYITMCSAEEKWGYLKVETVVYTTRQVIAYSLNYWICYVQWNTKLCKCSTLHTRLNLLSMTFFVSQTENLSQEEEDWGQGGH